MGQERRILQLTIFLKLGLELFDLCFYGFGIFKLWDGVEDVVKLEDNAHFLIDRIAGVRLVRVESLVFVAS